MSDESDSAEAEDTSNNGVSIPFLNTSVEKEGELKQESPKTSETQEATPQNANDDQIHINHVYSVSFYVGVKLFDTALYVRLFSRFFMSLFPKLCNERIISMSSHKIVLRDHVHMTSPKNFPKIPPLLLSENTENVRTFVTYLYLASDTPAPLILSFL